MYLKNILQKITFVIGAFLFISLFAKENITTLFFIVFSLLASIQLFFNRNSINIKKHNIYVALLLCYFIIAFIGYVINDISESKYLIRLIPFIISPLLIYYFSLPYKNLRLLIKVFVISNLFFLLALDIWAIFDMVKNKSFFIIHNDREYYRFLYTRYSNPDFFNHIYLSIYTLLTGILTIQYSFFNKRTRIIVILYVLIHLFILGSRACIISIILGIFVYFLVTSLMHRKNIKYLILFFGSLLLLSSITYAFKNTLFFNRYSQVFEWYNKKDIILEKSWSVNNRIKMYIIGTSAISNFNYIGINGTGIAEDRMKEEYELKLKNDFIFKSETFNPHNQYIYSYLDWGIIGLCLLVLILFLIIRTAYTKKLYWISFFWVSFTFLLTMESVLIRQRGIMLFILFLVITISTNQSSLIKSTQNEQNSPSVDSRS